MTFDSRIVLVPVVLLSLVLPGSALALPFGVHDARAVAMGQTGVAAFENPNAAYANPALLAAHRERKHLGGHQRVLLPTFSGDSGEGVPTILDLDDRYYPGRLRHILRAPPDPDSARAALNLLQNAESRFRSLNSEAIHADLRSAVSITVPDSAQGGAVSLSRRYVLDGQFRYLAGDRQQVSTAVAELAGVARGEAPGTVHPELYRDGRLTSPLSSMDSRLDVTGLALDELAFSMAWQVELAEQPFMLGLTPKWQRGRVHRYRAPINSLDLTDRRSGDAKERFNLDVGYAQFLGEHWTLGLAAQDLIERDFRGPDGERVSIGPRLRAGARFRRERFVYTVDLDVTENDALGSGDASRMLGLGGEWNLGQHSLRAGLRKDLAASGENAAWAYSAGFRLAFGAFFADVAWAEGRNRQSAAIHLGFNF